MLGHVEDREFTRQGRGDERVRDVERRTHGRRLADEAAAAFSEQDERREELDREELAALGVVVTIEGASREYLLKLDGLEAFSQHRVRRPKWLLLSVSPTSEGDGGERAVVWVSDQYRAEFLRRFEEYLDKESARGNPRHNTLVANMARIRATVLEDLWQSAGNPPTGGDEWWELWLRPEPNALELLQQYAEANDLAISGRRLILDARVVAYVRARWEQLLALPFTAVPLAEIRRPQFVDTIEDLDDDEQQELVEDLGGRVRAAGPEAPAVCLLDSGVRRTHDLLSGSLDPTDVHSVVGGPVGDLYGHGTRMAGLALYGPMDVPLLASGTVVLRHRLESVKYLPDTGSSPHAPETYGLITAEAVSLPEIVRSRRRVYCMPVTAPGDRPGEPSLWSAAVDALAAGTDVGHSDDGIELLGPPDPNAARLIIVSAGNVDPPYEADYRLKCDLSPIEDPAQAWNALVIGAYTSLCDAPTDPSFAGWSALGVDGDISPHTRTGVAAGGRPWPTRPDVCMEGGNVLTDGAGDFHHAHPLLSLLTTGHRHDRSLSSANATSAATAQASRLAALAMATYPSYWPETVRALIVHAAEWTPLMREEIDAETGKESRRTLLKRFGWGVPAEAAVLTSARNAVTMVVQDEFVPFQGDSFAMRHFRLHQLPWPAEVLEALGSADVELRATLSYFVEPNAARRGWRRRYAYASHGLRFELKSPVESVPDFVRRVNREAVREEEGGRRSSSGGDRWMIGPNQRNQGSLHQDIWAGSAVELAASGVLAVNAVGGWWKNSAQRDRADRPVRYSLLVSLRTHEQEIDLYTPIATQLALPVEAISIEI